LRDELSLVFQKEGEKIFQDAWKARNGYVEVILNRTPERIKNFFEQYGFKDLDEKGRIKGLKLLEMQRHALQMYASCGWFFADLAGLETILILQHASRALQLAEELAGEEKETKFLQQLSEGKSNLPEMGSGDQVYQRLVKPKRVTPEKVVNHFAISSLFDGGDGEKKIFSYRVERIHYERMEKDKDLLVIGRVRVTPDIIPEPREFLFGLIPSTREVFRTWVSENKESISFDLLREKGIEVLGKGQEEMSRVFSSLFGSQVLTIQDTFKEERQAIFQKLIQKEFDEHCQIYADLFDRTRQTVEALSREGLEIPHEIRLAAEVTLSKRLFEEISEMKSNFRGTIERGKIDQIVEEAKEHGYHLRREKSLSVLNEIFMEKMNALQESRGPNLSRQSELIEEVMTLLNLTNKWGFELSFEEAQNLMEEILEECVGSLEKCWWENGTPKLFSPNLITLAEKLGFDAEKFMKLAGTGELQNQS
jgi:hypothetical protein